MFMGLYLRCFVFGSYKVSTCVNKPFSGMLTFEMSVLSVCGVFRSVCGVAGLDAGLQYTFVKLILVSVLQSQQLGHFRAFGK